MQRYIYTARNEKGRAVKGVMIAENEVDLANKISQLGYFLTKFDISLDTKRETREIRKMPVLKPKELLRFTFQLATLLDAGLPLLESLKDLAEDAEREQLKKIINDVRFHIESGLSLKEALTFQERTFPKFYSNIVGSGEATGKLPQALRDLTALIEWQLDLKSKIKEASTYPLILFCVMVIVVTLLVVKVIPTFRPIFEQAGVDLPMPTKIVLGISSNITGFWYIWLIIIIMFVLGYKLYGKTKNGIYVIDSMKLKIPLLGGLIRKIALSRFIYTFSLAFKSGIHLLNCLDVARETTGNIRIERAISKARESVNMGEKLAVSLSLSKEFPSMVIRMVSVGEQSGSLSQILSKIVHYYENEVAATIKKIFTLFEPIMIVLMGLIVGTIALAMFLPMFKMAELVGG